MFLGEEIRTGRDSMRYGYAVGKVRVLETRALDSAAFERALDAPSFAEQKRLLSESLYGRYLEHAATAEDVERGLAQALDDFYRFLDTAALPEAVSRFFRIRHDFSNLKAALKARALGVPADPLLVAHGAVATESFSGDLTTLPAPVGPVAKALLARAANESTAAEKPEDGSADATVARLMALEVAVDRAMFDELLRAAHEADSAYLVELARLSVDIANARTLVRARAAGRTPAETAELLIEGGTGSIKGLARIAESAAPEIAAALRSVPSLRALPAEQLEQTGTIDGALDAVLAAALRRGRMGGQVGPEPVIAYVFAREAEVAALRVLLLGRLAGIDSETLRARVRVLR